MNKTVRADLKRSHLYRMTQILILLDYGYEYCPQSETIDNNLKMLGMSRSAYKRLQNGEIKK